MSVGLCGIYNLGNTCYINSILQCLSNVPAFRDILLGEEYTVHHQSRTQGQLVEALAGFMTSMWSINSLSGTVLNPKNIRTALQVHTRKFDGAQQQDAQEFLLYLLAAISEETKLNNQTTRTPTREAAGSGSFRALHSWDKFQTKEASSFSNIFVGQLRSRVCCPICFRTSTVYEIFWDLSLPVPSGDSTLYDCLDKFFNGEKLPNVCQYCKKANLVKLYEIQRLPPVLILWFKRFSYNYTQKINSRVRFPRDMLDLGAYLSDTGSKSGSGRSKYDLCAVSNHIGHSSLHGHYTAYCRRERSGGWYLFDDTNVTAVDGGRLDGAEAGCSAYILLYQRR